MNQYIEGSILRKRAKKTYRCSGDGANPPKFSNGCHLITEGSPYLEFVGRSYAYQSGTRHCMNCADKFYKI